MVGTCTIYTGRTVGWAREPKGPEHLYACYVSVNAQGKRGKEEKKDATSKLRVLSEKASLEARTISHIIFCPGGKGWAPDEFVSLLQSVSPEVYPLPGKQLSVGKCVSSTVVIGLHYDAPFHKSRTSMISPNMISADDVMVRINSSSEQSCIGWCVAFIYGSNLVASERVR